MNKKEKGRVKWFKVEKGFGFIEVDEGPDIFMHVSQLEDHIQSGDVVEFKLKDSKKGPVALPSIAAVRPVR